MVMGCGWSRTLDVTQQIAVTTSPWLGSCPVIRAGEAASWVDPFGPALDDCVPCVGGGGRASGRSPDVPAGSVPQILVHAAWAEFTGRRVRGFGPVLVERAAWERLSSNPAG